MRKINNKFSYTIMFVMIIILSLPLCGLSFQIKSTKIIKVGEVLFGYGGMIYRPVRVRVTYSCDDKKISTIEFETKQVKDKWGEWKTDDFSGSLGQLCLEEERAMNLLMNKNIKSLGQGELKKLIVNLNKAIELNPNRYDLYYNRGVVYSILGKYNKSIDDYNRAIDGLNKSVTDLDKPMELNQKYAHIYYARACSYSMIGNIKSAIQDLNKAIELRIFYKNDAKTQKDFDNIRNNPDFKKLISE